MENMEKIRQRIKSLVKDHPIIYDKTLRATEKYAEMLESAYVEISLNLLEEDGFDISGEAVKKMWTKIETAHRQRKLRAGLSQSTVCDKDDDLSFLDGHYPSVATMSNRIRTSNTFVKDVKNASRKRKRRPTKRIFGVPPMDDFAVKKVVKKRKMEALLDGLQKIFNETTNALRNIPINVPQSGRFNEIHRKVNKIDKEKYQQCMNAVLSALTDL